MRGTSEAYDRCSRFVRPLPHRWIIPPTRSAGDRPMDVRTRLEHALGAAYSIDRELAGGGMSHVYVAEERAFGRQVVVKVLREDLTEGASAARFKREITVAAKLQHPHIVPLLSAGEEGGTLYFTMPFVEGESLRARLEREGELPIADVVRVLREVASALAYAHRQRHRAPRHQAGERAALRRQRARDRLRDRQGARGGADAGRRDVEHDLAARRRARDAGVHGAGAGGGGSDGGSSRRSLRARLRRLRDADGAAAVRGAGDAAAAGGARDGGADADRGPSHEHARAADDAGDAVPREESRRPTAERGGGASNAGDAGERARGRDDAGRTRERSTRRRLARPERASSRSCSSRSASRPVCSSRAARNAAERRRLASYDVGLSDDAPIAFRGELALSIAPRGDFVVYVTETAGGYSAAVSRPARHGRATASRNGAGLGSAGISRRAIRGVHSNERRSRRTHRVPAGDHRRRRCAAAAARRPARADRDSVGLGIAILRRRR